MKNNVLVRHLTLAGLLLALGIVLPQFVHALPLANGGNILSPMHIPVLIAGFLLGGKYAVMIGILIPLFAFVLTGRPPIMPVGLSFMVELSLYGLTASLLYRKLFKGKVLISLVGAMIIGRLGLAVFRYFLWPHFGMPFSFELFFISAFVTALPGIAIQLALIPVIVQRLKPIYLSKGRSYRSR